MQKNRIVIDLNCDLGEGKGADFQIMPYISSCNIACGGHFGNAQTIDQTLELALEQGVKIGIHPSFPDKKNFGRKPMLLSEGALEKSLATQIDLFLNRLDKKGGQLHHVKAHGALYNQATTDKKTAEIIAKTVKKYLPDVFLYLPQGSEMAQKAAEEGLKVKYEAFADRNYRADGQLVSRRAPNALITDKAAVLAHLCSIVKHQKVRTVAGTHYPLRAETFCIHGDHKNAASLAKYLYQTLTENGIEIG